MIAAHYPHGPGFRPETRRSSGCAASSLEQGLPSYDAALERLLER